MSIGILIKGSADPDAFALFEAQYDSEGAMPARAGSQAEQVLRHELTRYCAGQIRGRSFLIGGHRGAGKTSMVSSVLQTITARQEDLHELPAHAERFSPGARMQGAMRPLPIFIQGPRIFGLENETKASSAFYKFTTEIREPVKSTHYDTESAHLIEQTRTPVKPRSDGVAQRMLVLSVLALHEAVSHEFSRRVWRLARLPGGKAREALRSAYVAKRSEPRSARPTSSEHMRAAAEKHRLPPSESPSAREQRMELAAQFEAELRESPTASRLREFWQRLRALPYGVLFEWSTAEQGMRELIALVGVMHMHQRVSGEIRQSEDQKSGHTHERQRTAGAGFDTVAAIKPLIPVAVGAMVATASAANSSSGFMTILLGVLSAIGASAFLKVTSTSHRKHAQDVVKTFLPDLSVTTLDRMLPMVLYRLNKAGLAPIFIIDELDKVQNLIERMKPLVDNLKKLFAESVATCILVDREFFEELMASQREEQYNLFHSYFSHRIFVTLLPYDLHAHLGVLLRNAASSVQDHARAEIDIEIVKWVFLHRSRLNALLLNRLIEQLRGDDGQLVLESSEIRSHDYRVEVTLQVAIQYQLADRALLAWMRQNERLEPALFDALYFLSRERALHADRAIDLGATGRARFAAYLRGRVRSA